MSDESPTDRFKSALTGATRALAHDAELELAWTADAPVETGKTLRVPMPGRGLPRDKAMEARGFADSFALKQRLHNAALHGRHAPAEAAARACYDAIETVRYEALGSEGYAGIRGNLAAAEDMRLSTDPIARATSADEVPMQIALALMLRERLTGQPVPQAARKGVDMVRDWIEQKAGGDLDALARSLSDQDAFQQRSLDLLRHLELTYSEEDERDQGDDEDEENTGEEESDEGDEDGPDDSGTPEVAGEPAEGDDGPESETEADPDGEMGEADIRDEGDKACCPSAPTGHGPICPMISITRCSRTASMK